MLDEKLAEVDFVMRALDELRLKSFDDWPATFMDPKQMAEAGFYFTCHDMARCPFCKVVIGGWAPGDVPLDKHRRLRPSCSFVVKHADEGVCVTIRHCKYCIH
jgi:hypothetical protein